MILDLTPKTIEKIEQLLRAQVRKCEDTCGLFPDEESKAWCAAYLQFRDEVEKATKPEPFAQLGQEMARRKNEAVMKAVDLP
jgi:hypothetical protein